MVNNIVIAFTGDPDRLPFDPRTARLQAATTQLTDIAGHFVTFQFDTALLPQWRSSFEEALIEAIENVARDIESLRATREDLYALARGLERVECRYVAVPTDHDLVFDPDRRTLEVALSSEASSFVREGWLSHAVEQAHLASQSLRFADAQPERVDDPALYVRYLTDRRADSDTESRARTVWLVTRVYPRLQGAPRARAQEWLAKRVEFFADAYRDTVPKGPSFRAAETAWVAWLNAGVDQLTEPLRGMVMRKLLVERRDRRPGETAFRSDTFSGFDVLGYGLRVLDAWAAAGHPVKSEENPRTFQTFIYFVCPAPRDSGGEHTRYFACDHVLYRLAADSDAGMKRLSNFLFSRKDPALVEAAFVNYVRMQDSYSRMLTLWRALEAHPALWEAATRAVDEGVGELKDLGALEDETQRQWRAMPAERGILLYQISRIEDAHYGSIVWKDFGSNFGSLASAQDFGSFLDQNDLAFWNAHEVWDALSPGWSRAAILTSRLDGYLDRQRAVAMTPHAIDAIGRIATRLCEERASGDLALLHAWLVRRVAAHASEQRDLEPVAQRTSPGACSEP